MGRPTGRGTGPFAAPSERAGGRHDSALPGPSRAGRAHAIPGAVRLTKGRVLLRVALLAGAGVFMVWRATERFQAGAALGADGLTLRRLALFEALLAAVAFALAAFVLLALRRRRARRPLGLGRPPEPPSER